MVGEPGREHLEGDDTVEPCCIGCLVPLLRVVAYRCDDFILAKPCAGFERHGLYSYCFSAVVQLRTAVIGAVETPAEIVPALRSAATTERTVAIAAFVAATGP